MEIIRLLANDNYLVVNRDLMHILGLECAVYFSELCSEAVYWDKTGKSQDGWFYSTAKNVEGNICIKWHKQKKYTNELIAMGLLEAEVRGMPATRYFRVNEENLRKLFLLDKFQKDENLVSRDLRIQYLENEETRITENEKQVSSISRTNNTKDNNTKTNSTKKSKHAHGEFQNVKLTDDEMQKLMNKLGTEKTAHCITFLDEYKERKGYKCKSDYLTILKWVVSAVEEEEQKKAKAPAKDGSRVAWIREAMEDMGA